MRRCWRHIGGRQSWEALNLRKPIMERYRRYVTGLLIATSLWSAMGSVLAGTPPPKLPSDNVSWPASMKRPPTRGIVLGKLSVAFEKTALAEVLEAAPRGFIQHQGDAGDSIYWLCYTRAGANVAYRLWIVSDGEMGGNKHAVTMVTAQRITDAEPTKDCPALPASLQPVSLDVPIWIGTTDREVERVLGPPSHRQGMWGRFDYQGKVPGPCQGGYDMYNWLWTRSEHARISGISAGQVTTC